MTSGAPAERYTVKRLGRTLAAQMPELVKELPSLLEGIGSLGVPARLAVQLRMARLFGCPVCLRIFPWLAGRVGLAPRLVEGAIDGRREQLPAEAAGSVAWIEVVLAGGGAPDLVPAAAMELSSQQRAHLLALARLEQVVHATGLMLLPHAMIERALGIRAR